jgi:lia operon protein LiaG
MRFASKPTPRAGAVLLAATVTAAFALALVLAMFGAPAHASDLMPGRHVLRGEKVQICNAIGSVSFVPSTGSDVVVEITTHGEDASKLRVAIDDCDGARRLRVVYPSNRVEDPKAGRFEHRETTLDGCCGKERIIFTRPGDGLDARADLVVHVPKGQKVLLGLGTGSIDAEKLDARLSIDTGAATIHVKDGLGALSIDSGSGGAAVEGFKGALAIDSGSGGLDIEDLDGTVAIDSGSGRITLSHVRVDKAAIDSGSGAVTGDDIIAGTVSVDCGSGGIELTRLSAKVIVFDNGSGGVTADLANSPSSLKIESGSGGVTLTAPHDLDARLQISCSKRNLSLHLPVVASTISNSYFEGKAGSGRGLIVIETGSGGVSLSPRSR